MGTLDGRVAIVTGGSGALGSACAHALSAAGAAVVIADIDKTRLVVTAIHDEGREATGVHCDVAYGDSAFAMVAAALDTFGRVDILVNNATVLAEPEMVPFEEITEEVWDRAMAVNLKGMWQCARAVTPPMRRAGRGRIINIGGDTTWDGAPGMLHVASSKAAVPGFTRSLAHELADTGITVNMVSPGRRGEWSEQFEATLVFLASDGSGGVSGQLFDAAH